MGAQVDGVLDAPDAGTVVVGEPLELFELLARGVGVDLEVPVDPIYRRVLGDAEGPALVDLGLRTGAHGAQLDALAGDGERVGADPVPPIGGGKSASKITGSPLGTGMPARN